MNAKFLSLVTCALMVAGCETPYQKNPGGLSTGGYQGR